MEVINRGNTIDDTNTKTVFSNLCTEEPGDNCFLHLD